MRAFEIFGASLASGLMTPADVTSKSPLLARTRGLRCFLSRALFEDKRPHSKQGWTGKDDPNRPSPLALAKLQNKASVPHGSFARKMLRFVVVFDLPRAVDTAATQTPQSGRLVTAQPG
jgi:hypothetical protein